MSKRVYAVQHGNDYACDYSTTVKRTAYKMARELTRKYPDEEIRIAFVTNDDDYVEREIIIQEGEN